MWTKLYLCFLTCFFGNFPFKEQVSFNFMAAGTVYSDFGAQENKVCHCFHWFPIYLPWSDGTECHDLSFLNVEFKPAFSFSSLIFIKRLSSSSLSAIRVVSSAYLRLLIFLPGILIPACASSSLAFHMMYFVYKSFFNFSFEFLKLSCIYLCLCVYGVQYNILCR